MMQISGDMETLEAALGKKVLSRVKGSGHCSALIKVFPGTVDLGVSQVTWDDYNSMLRVFKRYEINVHHQDSKGNLRYITIIAKLLYRATSRRRVAL